MTTLEWLTIGYLGNCIMTILIAICGIKRISDELCEIKEELKKKNT